MKFGLTAQEFQFIEENLAQPLKEKKAKVFVFGSRAKGNHHKFSDIDICYQETKGSFISAELISKILVFFDDSDFPFHIDLVNYSEVAASYRTQIDNDKVEL